jgi:predicted peptidase
MIRLKENTLQKEFVRRIYQDINGNTLPYRLLLPRGYDKGTRYPVVVFLHGAGEKGTDNQRQVTNGVEKFAEGENRRKYPAFVVVPQCPPNRWWTEGTAEMTLPLALVFEIVEALAKEFSVDEKRIYITGISMGGFGAWDAISRKPGYFAAAVPVCGGGDPSKAELIKDVPVWAFHGAEDTIVDVRYSRQMVRALEEAGGKPKYTEYRGVGHASWEYVYSEPAMYAWLFAQKRS